MQHQERAALLPLDDWRGWAAETGGHHHLLWPGCRVEALVRDQIGDFFALRHQFRSIRGTTRPFLGGTTRGPPPGWPVACWPGFDISVLEIFWPLCFGFSLFLASANTARNGAKLAGLLESQACLGVAAGLWAGDPVNRASIFGWVWVKSFRSDCAKWGTFGFFNYLLNFPFFWGLQVESLTTWSGSCRQTRPWEICLLGRSFAYAAFLITFSHDNLRARMYICHASNLITCRFCYMICLLVPKKLVPSSSCHVSILSKAPMLKSSQIFSNRFQSPLGLLGPLHHRRWGCFRARLPCGARWSPRATRDMEARGDSELSFRDGSLKVTLWWTNIAIENGHL